MSKSYCSECTELSRAAETAQAEIARLKLLIASTHLQSPVACCYSTEGAGHAFTDKHTVDCEGPGTELYDMRAGAEAIVAEQSAETLSAFKDILDSDPERAAAMVKP